MLCFALPLWSRVLPTPMSALTFHAKRLFSLVPLFVWIATDEVVLPSPLPLLPVLPEVLAEAPEIDCAAPGAAEDQGGGQETDADASDCERCRRTHLLSRVGSRRLQAQWAACSAETGQHPARSSRRRVGGVGDSVRKRRGPRPQWRPWPGVGAVSPRLSQSYLHFTFLPPPVSEQSASSAASGTPSRRTGRSRRYGTSITSVPLSGRLAVFTA